MRIKFILIFILCISLLFPLSVFAAASPEVEARPFQQADIIPGELIVIMKTGNSIRGLSLPEKVHGATKQHNGLEKLNAGVVNVPAGQESEYIAQLKKQKGVLVVEPNYRVSADFIPDDTFYASHQYAPALIQAPLAWDTTTGSSSVVLAIIDSGIDFTHPEFAGRIVAGYDFVENDTTPQDECGHGTHVAGIAAAAGNNAQGIAGVDWNVKIMPLRMLNRNCGGSFAGMADALVWAADHGAQVVNISVGGSSPSTLMENAVYYAYSHGTAIFAASGNAASGSVSYPAAYPQVMAVGSVDSSLTRASSSNYGTALDLMAPGVDIYSTLPMQPGFLYNTFGYSTEYDYLSGTSMASPHAAGAAALLASQPQFDTPAKIYEALTSTALDLTSTVGWDNTTGYGLIQLANALAFTPTPTPPVTPPFAVEYDLVNSTTCSPLTQYNWRDASGGTPLVSVGNSSSALINLPFNFNFGGAVYTQVRAHANGFISMGNNNTDLTENNFENNFQLPGIAKPNNFIAPFWDDLTDPGDARLYTTTIGVSPNREFVIEYSQMEIMGFSSNSNLQFEVILFEGSNNIKMQYHTLTGTGSDGSSASVGLEYANGLAAQEYSHNQVGALKEGLALLFIPYTGGAATLPSNGVCSGMRAKTINAKTANACITSPGTFDVEIPVGKELLYRSILKVQQLTSAPRMPNAFLDLHHYADIHLTYSPPAPSLSPMPEVYVCYEYTAQDVLAAGGHPENLFITAQDESTAQWQPLGTTVDLPSSRLMVLAPHFSYYGVATFNTASTASTTGGLDLPVTGSLFSREFLVFLIALGIIVVFLLSGTWMRRKRRRE